MDGISINRLWVTSSRAWSWTLGGDIINFRSPPPLRIRSCLGGFGFNSLPFICPNSKVHKSVSMGRDESEIHNHSSLWHWWKLSWIKCIGILIMNLWYSELPLGHQYLICNHILQATEWLSGYTCADWEKTSYSLVIWLWKDDL